MTTTSITKTSTYEGVTITFVETSENNGATQRVVVSAPSSATGEIVVVGMIEKSCIRRHWTLTQFGGVVGLVSKNQGLRLLKELAFAA
jgi:hypothetical protein